MPKLTFVAQSARDSWTPEATGERLVNCYAERAPDSSRTRLNIRTVLGQEQLASNLQELPGSGSVRAVIGQANADSPRQYACKGGKLYEWTFSTNTAATDRGSVNDSLDTSMAFNGEDVCIAADGTYYFFDKSSNTLSTPGSGAFSDEGSVANISGYTVITEQDGQRFEWTELADGGTRNALYFATADAVSDNLIRAMSNQSQLWLFGEQSIEIWYPTGDSGANAFARLPNGVIDRGLWNYRLITRVGERIMFVGEDGRVYATNGAQIEPISTPAVESVIERFQAARCFEYFDRGHHFGVIICLTEPAFVYDFRTGLWHERASPDALGNDLSDWDQDFAVFSAESQRWYGLDVSGNMWQMDDTYADLNSALKRRMVSRPIYMDGDQFSVSEVEFLAGMGRSATADVKMRISKDGGRTWGSTITRSLGGTAEYDHRAVFRALGVYRHFTAEFVVDEDTEIPLYSDANVRLG
jgi:hypothetical protein